MLLTRSLRVGVALCVLLFGALLPTHAQDTPASPSLGTMALPAGTASPLPNTEAPDTADEPSANTVPDDDSAPAEPSEADPSADPPEAGPDSTPVDSAPVDSAPVDSAPVDSTPVTPSDNAPTPTVDDPTADDATVDDPTVDDPTVDDPSADDAVRYLVENNALVARQAGLTLWQLGFAEGSGQTVSPLQTDANLYVGHGNSVLRVDAETGRVLSRWLVPNQVLTLDADETGVGGTGIGETGVGETGDDAADEAILITVQHSDDLTETVRLRGNDLQDTVRFGIDPALFGWLRQEAQIDEPAARLAQDSTNPWLYLAAGQARLAAGDADGADNAFLQAVDEATTFYDLAGISQALLDAGRRQLSDIAFDAALRAFADSDYDPSLLRSRELHDAYNFPLSALVATIDAERVETANVLAERLWLVSPRLGGTQEALEDYARLREATGRSDIAALWRERARGSAGERAVGSVDQLVATLAASGWYAAVSIIVAILTLHLTLLCKYWIPQGKLLRRSRSPFGRLFAIRYYSVTEKAVLVMMFAAVLALGTLGYWSDENANLPLALSSGTLANEPAQAYLSDNTLSGPRGDFILGYTAHISGATESARSNYQQAGDYPPALNNLGALLGDPALFDDAIALAPELETAYYNLSEQVDALPFEAAYRDGYALVTPTRDDFLRASGATWENALLATFANPWQNLAGARPPGIPPLVWQLLYLVVLTFATLTVVMLFVPQPRIVQQAPRTFLFHVFALLIPGSSLADEAWGLLLIVPWAIIGLDTMSALFDWGIGVELGLTTDYLLLAILYTVNLIAFIVEFLFYRQRMLERRRRRKEGTRSFSLS